MTNVKEIEGKTIKTVEGNYETGLTITFKDETIIEITPTRYENLIIKEIVVTKQEKELEF